MSLIQHEDDGVLLPRVQRPDQGPIPGAFVLPRCNGYDLFEINVDELQHLFSIGSLTSFQYTSFCLERIRRVNPYLECIIETNPDALTIAHELDDERARGALRGPLHGIPVLVKDNMATADAMQTTAGSWALLGCSVPKDAHIVTLLRRAGAIILAHTNLDEWAGMRSSFYSVGYSARGGQTRNAYDLTRSPQGSSSGSAVAVSANIAPLSFGTETDTSIIWPAMAAGIVGIKPTVGLTSRGGVVPISETQDSVGPLGRCVADAVRGLDAIVGVDEEDKFTLQPGRRQEPCYSMFLAHRKTLRGARFGLPMRRFWDVAPRPQRDVVDKVLQLLVEAGAEVVSVDMPCAEERIAENGEWNWEHGESSKSEFTVNKVECYGLLNAYLSRLQNTSIKTVEDVVRFNEENTGTEGAQAGDHPAFPTGQDNFHKVLKARGVKDDVYNSALHHMQQQCRKRGIDAALQHKQPDGATSELDALLFCDVKGAGQQIAAQAGYPVITIPVGVDPEGMPVGLSLQHTAWREGTLVRWASAIEDLVKAELGQQRETPQYEHHLAKNVPVEPTWRY